MPDQTIRPEATVSRDTDVLASHLGDETVMMDVDQGCYYGLNVTATRIWDMLTQPTTVSGLCAQLAVEFAVPLPQCEQEVLEFLEDLMSRGLVKVVTHAAS
jgi:hypothetical protein